MNHLLGRWLFLLMVALTVFPAGAQNLQILTEEDPPYSLTGPDKKPTGYGVEVSIFQFRYEPEAKVCKGAVYSGLMGLKRSADFMLLSVDPPKNHRERGQGNVE